MPVTTVGDTVYLTVPIEIWREFLDKPKDTLLNVFSYCATEYESIEEARKAIGFSNGNWESMTELGEELRLRQYGKSVFSISKKLYFDYFENKKSEYDNLLLLAYLALNSMRGKFTFSNSTYLFARMAGYGTMDDFKEDWKKNKKGGYDYRYRCNNIAISKYSKSKQILGRTCAKLRLDLMRAYPHVHCYSEQGKRDFAFMFDEKKPREYCIKELARIMHYRGKTVQRDELKEMMKKAKESIDK
ncbi:MAG: hypothetical protein IJU81_05510 [Bacteroidales bacterium]|nr:hypothetical protein [Bacteroidales bacterium]